MMFSFGKNWYAYCQKALTSKRIHQFRYDFDGLFKEIDLKGKRFIDIGFGQGLALVFAAKKGARAVGIDIDPENIKALEMTRHKTGLLQTPKTDMVSILDDDYVERFCGYYDIVHSWGVLHHTGNMAKAIENACLLVSPRGYFICSIYNRHWSSPVWKKIKWLYNQSPLALQKLLISFFYPLIFLAKWMVTRKNPNQKERGMDFFYDVIDWVGGYPYEYAAKNEIIDFVSPKEFKCLRTSPPEVPTGCNEFIFQKEN